jgi:hypothetical protein
MLAERKDLGQLRASEAGTGFESPHPILVSSVGHADSEGGRRNHAKQKFVESYL